eukprot:SAG11_NODE_3126_length_2667_cov_4.469237_2_plen_162_part_00
MVVAPVAVRRSRRGGVAPCVCQVPLLSGMQKFEKDRLACFLEPVRFQAGQVRVCFREGRGREAERAGCAATPGLPNTFKRIERMRTPVASTSAADIWPLSRIASVGATHWRSPASVQILMHAADKADAMYFVRPGGTATLVAQLGGGAPSRRYRCVGLPWP